MKFVWVPSIARYLRTEGEAKKQKLAYEVVEIETDKDSLIARFNGYEQRIDDGKQQESTGGHTAAPQESIAVDAPEPEVSVPSSPRLAAPVQPSYLDWSLKLDEEWAKLPLAHKLSFAADAMECARDAVVAKANIDNAARAGAALAHGDGGTEHSEAAAA